MGPQEIGINHSGMCVCHSHGDMQQVDGNQKCNHWRPHSSIISDVYIMKSSSGSESVGRCSQNVTTDCCLTDLMEGLEVI